MIKYYFNKDKYISARSEHEDLTLETAKWLLEHSCYAGFNGKEKGELERRGYIILSSWCDERDE